MFGNAPSTLSTTGVASAPTPAPSAAPTNQPAATPSASRAEAPTTDTNALIAEAARNLADYQRLTAEGKLGEAGMKLEALKRTLDALQTRR